mmetsp:Transcript_15463/g.39374  ORF Transcript_15463/g.39374 Transcript_15463/m.39374 type:complete len:300 (-) Transcript_15463:45-944(-)
MRLLRAEGFLNCRSERGLREVAAVEGQPCEGSLVVEVLPEPACLDPSPVLGWHGVGVEIPVGRRLCDERGESDGVNRVHHVGPPCIKGADTRCLAGRNVPGGDGNRGVAVVRRLKAAEVQIGAATRVQQPLLALERDDEAHKAPPLGVGHPVHRKVGKSGVHVAVLVPRAQEFPPNGALAVLKKGSNAEVVDWKDVRLGHGDEDAISGIVRKHEAVPHPLEKYLVIFDPAHVKRHLYKPHPERLARRPHPLGVKLFDPESPTPRRGIVQDRHKLKVVPAPLPPRPHLVDQVHHVATHGR